MLQRYGFLFVLATTSAVATLLTLPVANAQTAGSTERPRFNVSEALGLPSANELFGQQEPLQLKATYELQEGTRTGRLFVRATMAASWHVFSLTQPAGGPLPTSLTVEKSASLVAVGPFAPEQDPVIHRSEFFPVPVEQHEGSVRWVTAIELAESADPDELTIPVEVEGQVCQDEGSCIPFERVVKAEFTGYYKAPVTGTFRAPNSHLLLRGHVMPAAARPGDTVRLVLTAIPDADWHVYAFETKDSGTSPYKPTLIAITKSSSLEVELPEANSPPQSKRPFPNEPELFYHEDPVSWTVELKVPENTKPGEYPVAGLIGYQTCTEISCDMPMAARFEVLVPVAAAAQAGQRPLAFTAADYRDAATSSALERWVELPAEARQPLDLKTLLTTIVFGLLGGLILNLMPCVLPVIGLKILSFASQGGESRGRILALNLWFAAGLIAVFMVLATLAAFLKLGWGEQFTLTWFKVSMVGLVFAMALSFLGVWEIPIPGFMGSGKSNELQAREGASGAFFKGVFTTVLATPCSGPFLGPVFAYTLSQPAHVIYILFLSVGVGMALPYILAGLFPGIVRLLPKPGHWMETFKQLMGFVLLGTVVYLFMTIKADYFIPTLTMLVGIWFACWWIGRVPITASLDRKAASWIGALGIATAVGFFGFSMLGPQAELLPWQPYSPAALAQAQAEGRTVMVDFTAEWCLTCKWNLKQAINTRRVQEVVEQNDVVTLLADWTDRSEVIKQKLAELDSASIPLLAIYPADRPGEPIVLRDLLEEGDVVGALEKAGPSKGEAGQGTASRSVTPVRLAAGGGGEGE